MRTTLFFQRHVGWALQISCLILPVLTALILTFVILSPPTFPTLALYELKGVVYVNSTDTIYEAFNFTTSATREVGFSIHLGPGGGCMKYDHERPICQRSLHFKPTASYLHLPPNETFIENFPTMGWMAFSHVALVLVGLSVISFSLGPFVPDCYFVSTGILWIASIYSPIFVLMGMGFGLLSLDSNLTDVVPKVEGSIRDTVFLVFVIPILIILSTAIITQVCSKIKLTDPPGESADRTRDDIDIELQVQPSIDKCGN
ncbi:uncharacterized protein L199_003182 [Kwoniella botswanensis]|uniref:uncharacterized protein n=1 Tax=Kwoniella botswanensis TaxID=1268659 RepID=UPI00315D4D16